MSIWVQFSTEVEKISSLKRRITTSSLFSPAKTCVEKRNYKALGIRCRGRGMRDGHALNVAHHELQAWGRLSCILVLYIFCVFSMFLGFRQKLTRMTSCKEAPEIDHNNKICIFHLKSILRGELIKIFQWRNSSFQHCFTLRVIHLKNASSWFSFALYRNFTAQISYLTALFILNWSETMEQLCSTWFGKKSEDLRSTNAVPCIVHTILPESWSWPYIYLTKRIVIYRHGLKIPRPQPS